MIALSPHQETVFQEKGEALAQYGFQIEPFGPRTCRVVAVPTLLRDRDIPAALAELLDSLGQERGPSLEERVAVSLACHGAVKSGEALSLEAMRGLLQELEKVPTPITCPHGRPALLHISSALLEKGFGRR